MDTGHAPSDARDDFARQRRRQVLARLRARLAGRSAAPDTMLPFDEVVKALGYRGEQALGLQLVRLESIVGSTDRTREFDRRFRPTSGQTASRFERINAALRRGEEMPPIDVYRIGSLHFVRDGHHRVAVARALGWADINARVTLVRTAVSANDELDLADLPVKSHERLFYERVPLPVEARHRIDLDNGNDYGDLAESVEAWGFRYMQQHRELMDRGEIARAWFDEEYVPAVALLREEGILGAGSETRAFMVLSAERYRLLHGHYWDAEALHDVRERSGG